MNVHNIMEELVTKRVNDLYDQVKDLKAPWFTCDCEHCRIDTISYVLNRIPPKYVVSGRGLTHSITNEAPQLKADIDALGIEGMHAVARSQNSWDTANEASVCCKCGIKTF